MKLYIKWRYPNETETHEHTYHDIDPKTVGIHYGFLGFCGIENPTEKSWTWPISHVIEMEMEEE